MKMKILKTVGLCAALLLFFADISFAQPDFTKKLGVGARISFYRLDDTTLSGVEYDPDTTPFFEGNLTWFPINWFSLEFAAGYVNSNVDAGVLGLSLEYGEFEQFPILLTARFHHWMNGFTPESKLTFYGGGGMGFYINDFSLSSQFATALPGSSLSVDDSLGFHAAAGLEYFFNDSWALNFDLKYIWNEADTTSFVPGLGVGLEDLSLDTFAGGIGLKFYFW
jgi:outer membrane protein W